MTYLVSVGSDAICEPLRTFDLDDPDQFHDYHDYVFYLTWFDQIIHLEEGEKVTITCIKRVD